MPRSPAEELALRRSQLARRQRRMATKSGDSSDDASTATKEQQPTHDLGPQGITANFEVALASTEVPSVQEAKERAARMAQAELDLERKARAEAEHRAA
eukprot:SAG31_NODE_14361_length_811_cov_1.332865_2_plen_99_part_00